MKKNTLKKLMALGCAAALVLSMTACSGGADTAEDTSSETTEETADAAGTTEAVRTRQRQRRRPRLRQSTISPL